MRKKRVTQAALIGICLLISYFFLLPFLFMFFTSFKDMAESIGSSRLVPSVWSFSNYIDLLNDLTNVQIVRWLMNTLLTTILGVMLVVVVDTLAAYSLARLNLPGTGIILVAIVWIMSIPGIVTVFPAFYIAKNLNLVDSFIPLIFPYGANVLGVYMIHNFLRNFPKELEEAAFVDGANLMTILVKVVVPVIRPVLITLAFITFLNIYNDFLWPSLVISTNEMKTVTVGISSLVLGSNFTNPGMMMAATLVAVVPTLVLFVFLNRYIVQGVTNTGIK